MKIIIALSLFFSLNIYASEKKVAEELLLSEFYGRSLPPKHQVDSCLDFSRFKLIKISPNDVDYELSSDRIVWTDQGYKILSIKVTEGTAFDRTVEFQVKQGDKWIKDSFVMKLEGVDSAKFGEASILTPPSRLFISKKCFKP